MTHSLSLDQLKNDGLFPHQARFILEFLGRNSAPNHVIVAPPLTGKRFVTRALLEYFLGGAPYARILIVVPAPFLLDWELLLRGRVLAQLVDRQVFRELQQSAQTDSSPWANGPPIVLLSDDTAFHTDVMDGLAKTKWDLVVIEDAEELAPRLTGLVASCYQAKSCRLLFLCNESEPVLSPATIGAVQKHNWSRNATDWDGRSLFKHRAKLEISPFTRSAEEIRFIRLVRKVVKHHLAKNQRPILREALDAALASSPAAIQQRLLDERETMTRSSDPGFGDISRSLGERASTLDSEEPLMWAQSPGVVQALTELLERSDTVGMDTKLDNFLELVRRVYRSSQHVCVFSEFRHTTDYLFEALLADGVPAYVCQLTMPAATRAAVVKEYSATGGVIVVNDIAAIGIDLSKSVLVINYDLPADLRWMDGRWAVLQASQRPAELTMFALRDTSGVIPEEDRLLEKYGFRTNGLGAT